MQSLNPGTIIDDSLVIEDFVGQGGMGAVYKARHLGLGRLVAVKIMPALQAGKQESRGRFKREAKALSLLEHKNIVGFFNFGLWQEEIPYMAMEFLEGVQLDKFIAAQEEKEVHLITHLMKQIVEALNYAHEKGIVHRDLKPANILVLQNPEANTVKLVDFGLAKITSEKIDLSQKLTGTGVLIGSVNYMSPEQCLGKPADARSDIYSVGCLLYQIMSGAAPFEGETPIQIVHKQVHEEPSAIPEALLATPELKDLAVITRNCMAKDPGRRYQSAAALLADFSQLNTGGIAEFVPRPKSGSSVRNILTLILAISLVSALSIFVFSDSVFPFLQAQFLQNFGDARAWRICFAQGQNLMNRRKPQAAAANLKAALFLIRKYNQSDDLTLAAIEKLLAATEEEMQMKSEAVKHANDALVHYAAAIQNTNWEQLKKQGFIDGLNGALNILLRIRPDKTTRDGINVDQLFAKLEKEKEYDTAILLAQVEIESAKAGMKRGYNEGRDHLLVEQTRLAALKFKSGKIDEAAALFKQMFTKAEQWIIPISTSRVLVKYAELLKERNQQAEIRALLPIAKTAMSQLHEVKYSEGPTYVAEAYCNFASYQFWLGNKTEALSLGQTALSMLEVPKTSPFPDSYWDLGLRAFVLFDEMSQAEEAVRALRLSLDWLAKIKKNDWHLSFTLGKLYFSRSIFDKTVRAQMLEQVRLIEGRSLPRIKKQKPPLELVDLYYKFARTYMALDERTLALQEIDAAIEASADNLASKLKAIEWKVDILAQTNNIDEALALLEQAKQMRLYKPLNTGADYLSMGTLIMNEVWISVATGNYKHGEAALQNFVVPPDKSAANLRQGLDMARMLVFAAKGQYLQNQDLLNSLKSRLQSDSRSVYFFDLLSVEDCLSRGKLQEAKTILSNLWQREPPQDFSEGGLRMLTAIYERRIKALGG